MRQTLFVYKLFRYIYIYTSSFAARHIGEATINRRTRASPSKYCKACLPRAHVFFSDLAVVLQNAKNRCANIMLSLHLYTITFPPRKTDATKIPTRQNAKKMRAKNTCPTASRGRTPHPTSPSLSNLPVPKRQPTHFKELITYILHMCHLIHALVHQRKFLRQIVRTKWIKNSVLYTSCQIIPWSVTILQRRLTWFGHLNRLPDKAPAKIAFKEAYLRPPKNSEVVSL